LGTIVQSQSKSYQRKKAIPIRKKQFLSEKSQILPEKNQILSEKKNPIRKKKSPIRKKGKNPILPEKIFLAQIYLFSDSPKNVLL